MILHLKSLAAGTRAFCIGVSALHLGHHSTRPRTVPEFLHRVTEHSVSRFILYTRSQDCIPRDTFVKGR